MRLGVYGGTFDPIHNGHLEVADRIASRFRLDRLLFVPAASPPHKQSRAITHACHRFAMVALAVAGRPEWLVSTVEIDCDGPHYTVDTIDALHATYPEAAPLYFLMGADSFRDLPTWREYLRLTESCNIIVTARPGHELGAAHLPDSVRRRLVDLRDAPPGLPAPHADTQNPSIYLTTDALIDISSTAVRERARSGGSLADLVPDAVASYITKQELYTHT